MVLQQSTIRKTLDFLLTETAGENIRSFVTSYCLPVSQFYKGICPFDNKCYPYVAQPTLNQYVVDYSAFRNFLLHTYVNQYLYWSREYIKLARQEVRQDFKNYWLVLADRMMAIGKADYYVIVNGGSLEWYLNFLTPINQGWGRVWY